MRRERTHSPGAAEPLAVALLAGSADVRAVKDGATRGHHPVLRASDLEDGATRDTLLAVLALLNEAPEPETVSLQILQITGEALEAQLAEMWLVDEDKRCLALRCAWSLPGIDARSFDAAGRRLPLAGDVGLVGHVWTTGEPTNLPIRAAEADRSAEAAELGLQHAAALPIHHGGQVTGVLAYFFQSSDLPDAQALAAMSGVAGHVGHFVGRVQTEAAAHLAALQMSELAATDTLTGLRNRREFDHALRAIPRRPFAILSLDVDHLKDTNDDHGHEAGDALLRAVASTVGLLVRGSDVLARVGGDEFAAILPDIEADNAARVAERFRTAMHALSVPFGRPLISVGWATAPAGVDPLAVWRTADECLYAAKRAGGDRVVGAEFSGNQVTMSSSPSHSGRLADVLSTRKVQTVFQPIVNLNDGTVIGYEALARPDGYAPTDSVDGLFDAARRAGRLPELDLLCRRVAIKQAAALPTESVLFINVCTGVLLKPTHRVAGLLLLLKKAGRPPELTVLEFSERERIGDLDLLMRVLESYRSEGVRFAIDDVGEGQATFELLAATRAEYVKLGRSLTMTASRAGSKAAIKAAVTFALATQATVIAEGVENEFACDQMRALGIEFGQGFGLGKPTLPDTIEDVVKGMSARAALRPLRPGADRPGD
jgi:diguanylate cyclase (GGDEF)-like protein